jgi:diketogulonate reductase-like aldo/keto reductase
METWKAMEDLHVDKRVRVIGLSNFSLRQLKQVVEHKVCSTLVTPL